MKVHHIGYLVKNINKSIASFEKIGFLLISDITHDEIRKVDICFLKNGNYVIELVSPYSPESVTYNLLSRYKNAPYHICYETNDLDKEVSNLVNSGFIVIQEKEVAPAIDNKNVVFLFNTSIGIIELVEK